MNRAREASWWLALAILLFALVNLVFGWGFGIGLLQRGGRTMAAMVPETGFGVMALAAGQMLLVQRRPRPAAALALALGVSGYVWLHQAVVFPGLPEGVMSDRMSVATALLLSMLGIAQALTLSRGGGPLQLGLLLGALVIALGGVTSFLFDVHELDRYRLFRGLSVLTALSSTALALAGLLARPDLGAIRILFDDSAGGQLARRFLPPALLIPVGLALIGDLGTDLGLIGATARLAFLAVVLTALAVSLVVSLGLFQDRLIRQEKKALDMVNRVLEGIDAGVVVLDPRGRVEQANPRFLALTEGVAPEDWLAGTDFRATDGGGVLSGAAHPVTRVLSGAAPEMAFWTSRSGAEFVLQFAAFEAGTDLAGELRRVVVVSDVTQAWQQRATMAETERLSAVGQLAGGLAHEVTNIFGVIKLAVGTAELIAPTGAPDQYAAIQNACRRGGELVDRLQRLSLASVRAERSIDAVAALRAACDLAARGLPGQVALTRRFPEGPLQVVCDPTELEMALLNLVLNARNAIVESGRPAGRIEVALTASEAELRLSVTDDGPGIPEALLDRVREPFFTTRRSVGGTGFGLALIDMFAERSSGRLELANLTEGGTEARLCLPLAGAVPAADDRARPEPVDLTGLRLLIAEDDRALNASLREALAALHADVSAVGDTASARDMLVREGPFDLLLTAINFAGFAEGLALAREAVARDGALRVVILTADRESVDRAVAAATGDAGPLPGPVLFKPVHLGVLSQTIAGLVRPAQGRS